MQPRNGFTIIELLVVIVVLGFLAAVVVPKFVNMKEDALNASKSGMTGIVKSAHALVIARKALNGDSTIWPTVQELVDNIDGENVSADTDGVLVDINGVSYKVPTYRDSSCTHKTNNGHPEVVCIGTIP